jgi:hypothetical protein
MFRRTKLTGLAVTAALMTSVLVQASPALAKAKEIGFQGTAFGTSVNIASTVESGRSAASVLGCTTAVGVQHTNTSPGVTAPELLTGTIDTSAASESTSSPAGVASTSSTTIQSARLLGNLVVASAVTSASTTSRDNATGTLSTSAAGTQFVGLTVAGVPITGTPAPNTKLTLPGVGYVVLNQQTSHVGTSRANLTVIGLHVVVTLSTPVAPVGTNIIVGYASSGLGGPFTGLLNGLAYAAQANLLSGIIVLGRVFPQPLACFGTNGVAKTNGGALVGLPVVLTSGTAADTVAGVNDQRKSSAEVSSTIQGLDIGAGLITATAVKADVTAAGNPPALGDNSSFLDLVVAGTPIDGTPAPNTKMSLAGIGTLWLHRVVKTANSIKVIMIQLVVTVPSNPLGLSPGTTVNVAYAQVGIS